jgi:hypothetical protein
MILDINDYPTDGVITLRPLRIDDAPGVYDAVRESLSAPASDVMGSR